MDKYNPAKIESKWQKKWEKEGLYKTPSKSSKNKFYILDMFPYPSAEGLHVGHFKGYTATDVIARYLRMKGYNVLHPMGWDAFGLPAENYAIRTGVHPAISTKRNITRIREQMVKAGFSYDWSKELNTTDPAYYRWTQWIFLKMYESGLAYEAKAPINFCPSCKTGLANEEVVNGRCERCGTRVYKKEIRQWILKITAYAERLLRDLEGLDWPAAIVEMQKNWIGRSVGAEIEFIIHNSKFRIRVFTTRPDTLFGATFMVLAPEHPLIWQLKDKIANWNAVEKYVVAAKQKNDLERQESKIKSGIKLEGVYAINPVNNSKIPIYVADYVLASYGTGAIMAVPAHDERDFEFAKKFKLPIVQVIKTPNKPQGVASFPPRRWNAIDTSGLTTAYEGEGVLVNSGQFSGLLSEIAKRQIIKFLENKKLGKKAISYRLRDWIFSRQRYWGEPIPILHCAKCGLVPLREKDLPLKLPDVKKYQPTGTGESPLAAISDWVNTTCWKCGGPAKRETNTMPQWAGSCWYYIAYVVRSNSKFTLQQAQGDAEQSRSIKMQNAKLLDYWLPVDWYVGGAEHAVLHLLYARFWHKFLYDLGVVTTREPFTKLRNVGLVLGPNGKRMSKSRGNVVTPDEIIEKYGADTLRLYECFMGPFDQIIAWDPASVEGVWRFLGRVWNLAIKARETKVTKATKETKDLGIAINKLTKKVEEDILAMKFNTAVAAMMEFLNFAKKSNRVNSNIMKQFVLLIVPFAPHVTEELWVKLGGKYSVHSQSWPKTIKDLTESLEKTIVVQVNGRLRDKINILGQVKDVELKDKVLKLEKVKKHLNGKKVKSVIIVPGRLVNIVTSQ